MQMHSAVLWKLCVLVVLTGVHGVGVKEVSVAEGEEVTLPTDVKAHQHEKIKWFCNDTRIAEINGIKRYSCTDVQCKESTERFRGRLKLDNETGSLTITNTRTTDSGLYLLEIINSGSDSETTFSVTVHAVSVVERDKMKGDSVEEGESDSGLSPAAVAGICAGVLLLFVAAAVIGVICYRKHHQGQGRTGTRAERSSQVFDVTYTSVKRDAP